MLICSLSRVGFLLRASCTLLLLLLALKASADSSSRSDITPVPRELASTHFVVTVDGLTSPVMHAVSKYYCLNFSISGPARITVTADDPHFWDAGVEVQPWRLGIRPQLQNATITFTIQSPEKISITRPGDHLAGAEMLFLFANAPERDIPQTNNSGNAANGLRYYAPGVHRENIDARSGDSIYLAPGAVIFGSLNIWDVDHVRVFGQGVIVYDGAQDPNHDEGWKNEKNWHVIGMRNAHHISVEGITCVVLSRTWMIQMKDTHNVLFDNVKVIGGSAGNANQDGMDWLGGGDAIVRNTFIRAADDIFAMYGNWDGYTAEALATPGHEVSNITIEDSVLSTSISNVVRVGWPRKSFDSRGFVMRNTDVIHMGSGGCGVPFALFEIWADPGGKGEHSDYLFDNIRMENWYSLVQLRQPDPGIYNVRFRDISALESPSMAPSVLLGSVDGVSFDGVKIAGKIVHAGSELPLLTEQGAHPQSYDSSAAPTAAFVYSSGMIKPGREIIFDASSSGSSTVKVVSYEWSFGDGSFARGPIVHHAFPDAEGTLRDHSGRFRVLLKTTSDQGRTAWAYEPVVVTTGLHPAIPGVTLPGLTYRYYEPATLSLGSLGAPTAVGFSAMFDTAGRKRLQDYAFAFDGYIDVPADGGYTFTLLSTDEGELSIDTTPIAKSPQHWPNVCGLAGNALQPSTGSVGLATGRHAIHVVATHGKGEDGFALLWQGPGIEQSLIPASALSHSDK